jgi:uncharacterized protein (TIGR00369 family)
MNVLEMSGIELMQAAADGLLPPPSISATMGLEFHQAEKGRVVFKATANKNHLNPMGGVHGGFAATVMDSVTGCVVHTMLEAGESYGTIDLAVKMMRPVPQDKTLIATGTIINMSKSLGISEGRLEDEDGKLYATATCTCKILRS